MYVIVRDSIQKMFNRILVPVNFNANTALVMQKAVEVANAFKCDLHLLHVQPTLTAIPFIYDGTVSGSWLRNGSDDISQKMEQLMAEYKNRLDEGLLMSMETTPGNWQRVLKEVIIVRHIDLVLIPRANKRFPGTLVRQININRLSQQTGCPVLTVTRRFDVTHLQHIVVPVRDEVPLRKLVVATYLARKFNGIIHLMGQNRSSTGEIRSSRSMMRAYQLLRDYSSVRVHCSTHDENTGSAETLTYAREVKADLIVVNPGRESTGRGIFGRWLGRFLFRESSIPVLTIAPYHTGES